MYPLQIGQQDRADIVANGLYGDAFRDWLLYLNNNVMDPYYDWYLDDDAFEVYLIDKYGSVPVAQQRVEYYRTQWPINNTQRVPPAIYQNNLPTGWQKYFQPVYNEDSGAILYYTLGYYDWRMSTNQLIQYNLSMTGNSAPFAMGNSIEFTSGPNVVGQGQVLECNSSILVAQHVANNFIGTPLGVHDTFKKSITGTVTNAETLQTLIPLTESVFWEPVTSYVMEDEKRAYQRFINTISSTQAQQVSITIQGLLQQGG